jgi:maleate isomerase
MMNRRQFVAAGTIAALSPRLRVVSAGPRQRWEPDGVGSLARIGVLTPDDDPVPESEIRTMAPEGISIHASRVLWNGDPGSLSFAEGAGSAAHLFARLAPRLILYAFTASSYVLGEEADARLRTQIEQRAGGIKVLSTSPAAVEALRLVGARKVVLIHPPWFAETPNAKGKDYFQARGFDVLSSMSIAPARRFQEVPPAEVYEWTVAHMPREADAVFIGGNGLRAIGTIHALEERLRKPVLTANQVLFWQALDDLHVASRVTRYGSLFLKTGR